MSRLESDVRPRFSIATEEINESVPGLLAVPLNMRRQVVDEFDREFRVQELKEREHRFNFRSDQGQEMAQYLANANLLLEEGEYQLALDMYSAALKIDPANEMAIRGMAKCSSSIGQHERAVEILKDLILKHRTALNYRLLGDELYFLGYVEDALGAYRQALSFSYVTENELFPIFKNMGNIFLKMGDPDAAEEHYNKAYTINPDSDVLLVNFGSLAMYRGNYDNALARFREAVQLNDKNDKAWVGLAMIHREYGDVELAWANIEKALDISAFNESAIKLVCEWAMKDNELERAISRIRAYVAHHHRDSQAFMWLAKFLYFTGRLADALAQIERALYLDPDVEGGVEVLSVIKSEIRQQSERAQ